MATKKQTVNFSKFFPSEGSFVTLKGIFEPTIEKNMFNDAFDLDLTIQTNTGRFINLYSWLKEGDTTLAQLKAINEATTQAIKFYENAVATQKEAKKKKEPIKVEPRVTKQRK